MSHHTTIDFETKRIEDRPTYPPIPVGVAIKYKGTKQYLAWGHPSENNCTKAHARRQLKAHWKEHLLFHNAAFDIEVAVVHMGLPVPKRWDDTLLLAYLHDPRAASLSLKPMAEMYLGMPPDEQTELKEWILAHIPAAKKKPSQWGAYIAEAPGKLVGKYAVGDVVRTEKLYDFFIRDIKESGMLPAYNREQRLIGIKLDMEQPGIRIAPKLLKDHPKWERAAEAVQRDIKKKLRAPKDFNLDSPKQLADLLVKRKKLSKIVKTPSGQVSTRRDVLEENCNDPDLIQLLGINSVLGNYLGTFIRPWVLSHKANEGKVYPTFNTIRSTDEYGRGGVGTRTGRFSSSNPNFQNIPTDVEESQHREILLALREYVKRYGLSFIGLRDYIVPEVGHVFISRDYSQQELRILAHYEDDQLLLRYNLDPNLDIHQFISDMIHMTTGIRYERKHVKITVFGIIYGMGLDKLAKRLGISYDEARKLRMAVFNAVPGIGELNKGLKECAKNKEPIYTWGGRRYYAEPDKWIKVNGEHRRKKLDYKLLNLLIQGSAADATKQGMINIVENCDYDRLQILVQVHDEVLAQVPKSCLKTEDKKMKEAMEDLHFHVPMLTDAKIGGQSWARLKKES